MPLHFAARSVDNAGCVELLLFGSREVEMEMQREMAPLFIGIVQSIKFALNCDRASLFLADKGRKRLWSVVADRVDPIIIPWDKGLAGACFQSRQTLSVADAWQDMRFENTFDKLSGYRTRSVLVEPLKQPNGNVLGVIQAINKHDLERGNLNTFNEDDQKDEKKQIFNDLDIKTLQTICAALARSLVVLTSVESTLTEKKDAENSFIAVVEKTIKELNLNQKESKTSFFKNKFRFIIPATRTREPGYICDGQYDYRRKHRHGQVVVTPETHVSWTIAKLEKVRINKWQTTYCPSGPP